MWLGLEKAAASGLAFASGAPQAWRFGRLSTVHIRRGSYRQLDVGRILHSAVFQKVFKANYTVGQVAHRQSGNIGRLESHLVLETLDVAMEMRTRQAHAWTMGRVRRIPMGRPVQIQASENKNFSAARLVLQACAVSVATFKIRLCFETDDGLTFAGACFASN
jgi:hypothetical protein